MPYPAPIARLVEEFRNRRPMRTRSLIVTLFGDVVSQHGGAIWLGSLVRTLALLGVGERLVRTSVSRLAQDGWLEAERAGRRSFYHFSNYGHHEYDRAARRIYALEPANWSGHWQLLLLPRDVPKPHREKLRRSLQWQGYRAIAHGTLAKPGEGGPALQAILEEFGVNGRVVILNAALSGLTSLNTLRELVHESWQLADLARAYRQFLVNFRSLARWASRHNTIDPEAAFVARTLLIHDYRRLLLHDTPLPAELLPPAWPGATALSLTSRVYRQLQAPSVAYVMRALERNDGPMPAPGLSFRERFARVH